MCVTMRILSKGWTESSDLRSLISKSEVSVTTELLRGVSSAAGTIRWSVTEQSRLCDGGGGVEGRARAAEEARYWK